MILTVTMNPSIDTRYELPRLVIDDVNRAVPERTPGGKGLNVSRVLAQLGEEVVATGLVGGHLGAYLTELLDSEGIAHEFSRIAGETRICLSILHEGNQTEILESGPEVSEAELDRFFETLRDLASRADLVTASGSLPRGVASDAYSRLLVACTRAGCGRVLLDSSGIPLGRALAGPDVPLLVKPNLSEANVLMGTDLDGSDAEGIVRAVRADPGLGRVPWVVVSLGPIGCVAVHGGRAWRAIPPRVAAVNATGSGDAMLAGLAHAISRGMDESDVLRVAVTCGTLNALDARTGCVPMGRWDEVAQAVRVGPV